MANQLHGSGGRMAELSGFDAWQLVETSEVARVAWHDAGSVTIVPVNHSVCDGAVWFRTTSASSLGRDGAGRDVAIEMDGLDAGTRSGWSVVVRGVIEFVDASAVPESVSALQIWPREPRSLYAKVAPLTVTGRRLMPPVDLSGGNPTTQHRDG